VVKKRIPYNKKINKFYTQVVKNTCASKSNTSGDVSNPYSCFNLIYILTSFSTCPRKTDFQVLLGYFNIHRLFRKKRHDFNTREACLQIISK